MKKFIDIVKSDFRYYYRYGILQTVVVLSLLFAGIMAFFPSFDVLIFIYVSVFVLPVIIFSVSFFLESEERSLVPLAICDCPVMIPILAKMVSALLMLLIPLVLDILVMTLVLSTHFNILLFSLVYLLAAVMHVAVGTVLAIISKSTSIMSVSYIAYIVVFSLIPIFYSRNLIPETMQYVMVISPAYLSGVLFQEIYYGYAYAPPWLLILSVGLQFVYIFVLTYFVIRPYFNTYLMMTIENDGKKLKN